MDTIAITYWNTIISPLYDSACSLLIVRPDDSRFMIDVQNMSLYDKAITCSEEGVTVLICGAISNIAMAILTNKGIRVLPWINGPVDKILCDYKNNGKITDSYLMPGCRSGICRNKGRNRLLNKRCRLL